MSGFGADLDAVAGLACVPTILDVVCLSTGMGFAAVARVTEGRWIACGVLDRIGFGLTPGDELKVETTICHEVRDTRRPVVIGNVDENPVYCLHPTPQQYGFKSYVSVPIVLADGSFFGTLCAIDPAPRGVEDPGVLGMFQMFAALIASQLDASRKITVSEDALARERLIGELREQFVAVLGHDLRNPLMAIDMGATSLLRHPERAVEIVGHMKRSIARMSSLIEDVLDFTRSRLGDGLAVRPDADETLEPVLAQVVQELQSVHPARVIRIRFDIRRRFACDRNRLAQLLSNLLGNALTHGDPDRPIDVAALTDAAGFTLSVANAGPAIPEEAREGLFLPFVRGRTKPGGEGLGLGLYIASQIARGHGGTLEVTSTPEETCFTFRMPI